MGLNNTKYVGRGFSWRFDAKIGAYLLLLIDNY